MPRPLLSHVDVRVSDRQRSIAFYDEVLGALGFVRRASDGDAWTSYVDAAYGPGSNLARGAADFEWFGFTIDAAPQPNANRIAFIAMTNDEVDRVADTLRRINANAVEGPDFSEGPGYYAVFFEDPDGHRLEVCCRTE